MGYALPNLPMNDEVLKNAKFVNVMLRDEASYWMTVKYLNQYGS